MSCLRKTADAILVQTIFSTNEPLRNTMVQAKISNSPDPLPNLLSHIMLRWWRWFKSPLN